MGEHMQDATPENMTMMQGFEWYVPADQNHWARLEKHIPQLKKWGIDNIWVPPGCKGSSPNGNGYDIYDLYDLGEFPQKSSTATKWGTKSQLLSLCKKAHDHGIGIYWDAVLNHKFAADHREKCQAVEVDPDDRNRNISSQYEIDAWVGFDFEGRGDAYSKQKYHWYHFSGVDYNAANGKSAIYKIIGDQSTGWARSGDVDGEKGNYDYLMGSDLDYAHPEVQTDVINWGKWLAQQLQLQPDADGTSSSSLKGIRFDAVKHYSEDFLRRFIHELDTTYGKGWFFVGEFWKDSLSDMKNYLDRMNHKFSLFDVPLVYNFSEISRGDSADLTRVFEGTLVESDPVSAVTLVMNHDTQPHQSLETPITDWFKPLAYALILLRDSGYPCIFYGDLYGIVSPNSPSPPSPPKLESPPSCSGILPLLTKTRKLYAYGLQKSYFDYRTCVGFVRYGTWDKPFGCAVIMSNAGPATKKMHVGEMHAGEIWTDILQWEQGQVVIGSDGYGDFRCGSCSVSVWVNSKAEGREGFNKDDFDTNIYEL